MKKTLTFEWWNDDRTPIPEEYEEELTEAALSRAAEMCTQGYVAGELCYEAEEVEYSGWWELSRIPKETT